MTPAERRKINMTDNKISVPDTGNTALIIPVESGNGTTETLLIDICSEPGGPPRWALIQLAAQPEIVLNTHQCRIAAAHLLRLANQIDHAQETS